MQYIKLLCTKYYIIIIQFLVKQVLFISPIIFVGMELDNNNESTGRYHNFKNILHESYIYLSSFLRNKNIK